MTAFLKSITNPTHSEPVLREQKKKESERETERMKTENEEKERGKKNPLWVLMRSSLQNMITQ